MKICPNCGSSLQGNENFCSNCGAKQPDKEQTYNYDNQSYGQEYSYSQDGAYNNQPSWKGEANGFAIAGFVLSIVGLFWHPLAILALIFSCIGLRACKRRGAGAYGLAIAGLVISILGVAVLIIGTIIEILGFLAFASYGFYF